MKLNKLYVLLPAINLAGAQQFLKPFPGSITSWAKERLDVFVTDTYGYVMHKSHKDGKSGWGSTWEFMNMTVGVGIAPASISWDKDRIDVFVDDGTLLHTYWTGSQWEPAEEPEILATGLAGQNIAVSSWAKGRFDIIAKNEDWKYVHKYYDGSAWIPEGEGTEDLGSDGFGDQFFMSDPAVVSWGKGRLDIFGILENGTMLHKYWDGTTWKPSNTGWEQFGNGFGGHPVATSWGKDRFDVWAMNGTDRAGPTSHRYWDGSRLSEWEDLGGLTSRGLSVVSWAKNRFDLWESFSLHNLFYGTWHKYWDGSQWKPNATDWDSHTPVGEKFTTEVQLATWGENNLNAFALDKDGHLRWQLWDGSQYLPNSTAFYDLGYPQPTSSARQQAQSSRGRRARKPTSFVIQDDSISLDL